MALIRETLRTLHRSHILDITPQVRHAVRKSGVKEGLAVIYVPHTTAAVAINENADPDVKHDVLKKLEAMIPEREGYYRHSEGNSDSHAKSILVGPSVTLIIDDGDLVLGTWQGVYFCEFDGPRTREVIIKVIAG